MYPLRTFGLALLPLATLLTTSWSTAGASTRTQFEPAGQAADSEAAVAADEAAVLASSAGCPGLRTQATGPTLKPATADQMIAARSMYLPEGEIIQGCTWQVGTTAIGNGERVTVLLHRNGDATDDLVFVRNDYVSIGRFPLGRPAEAEMQGAKLLVRTRDGEVTIPVGPAGPPAGVKVAPSDQDFEPDPEDRSDYAYDRALAEPPGSRSGNRCRYETRFPQADSSLRLALRGTSTFYPDSLGGFACFYKIGILKAEGGRRYGAYLVDWVYGLNLNHGQSRIVLLEDDARYDGNYGYEASAVGIEGADLVFHDPSGTGRIHIGPEGPPPRAFVSGDWQVYER